MEIVVTVYEKMRIQLKGNFTNPKLFTENGGHINKKHRERFNFIHEKNMQVFRNILKNSLIYHLIITQV